MAESSRRGRRAQPSEIAVAVETEGAPKGRRARAGARRAAQGPAERFYAAALSEAEQALLPAARRMGGLDEEIALLRVKVQTAVAEHPADLSLLLKGITTLVRMVTAQYRLSQRAEDDLYQNVLGVLEGIGGVLNPEGLSHED